MAITVTLYNACGDPIPLNWTTTTDNTDDYTGVYHQSPSIDMGWAATYPKTGYDFETPKREEVKDMRGLFSVYVVDYKKDQVLASGTIIASDEAKAKMKALHRWSGAVAGYDLDDLDIICVKLGGLRKKEEVQKVQVVKE